MSALLPRPTFHLLALAVAVLLLTGLGRAFGHAGHDHGDDSPAPPAAASAPVTEAFSAAYELVILAQGERLILWLDDFATNAPVIDAVIDVSGDGGSVLATARRDGSYEAVAAWATTPGSYDLIVSVEAPGGADLLLATLVIPDLPVEAAGASAAAVLGPVSGVWLGAAFLAGALLCLVVVLQGRRRAVAAAALIGGAILMVGGTAFAHEGHDHGPQPAAPVTVDTPQRLPDGSIHVPKPAQRLYGVRTVQVETGEVPSTLQLVGRIVPDPNGGGHVQATQSGRIEAGPDGLPYPGQQVLAGAVLAYVTPAVGAVERSGVQQQMAQIEKDIAIMQARVQRLRQLSDSAPRRDLEEAEASLLGLQRQRTALGPALTTREALVAPISGVVTASNVVIGQVIDGRDQVLFEIVDPDRLMVEAVAYDPRQVASVHAATAVTADGQGLRLEFVSRSLALRQQAIPMLFRINPVADGVSLGQPVHVLLEGDAPVRGVVLPRGAVVRSGGSQPVVWDHVTAQRFVARPVRLQPLDGERVVILDGVPDGARIVTEGAALLNQIR